MTEEEWLTAKSPEPMTYFLFTRGSNTRKLRLFACACCRAAWEYLLEDHLRDAVLAAEACLDGHISPVQMREHVLTVKRSRKKRDKAVAMVYDTIRDPHHELYGHGYGAADKAARLIASSVAPNLSPTAQTFYDGTRWVTESIPANADRLRWDEQYTSQHRTFADYLRCIFGNPFRPVAFDPRWRTETVSALATGIYADRAFDRLPVLADALEEAGCDAADALAHCRGPGPHARGCWVVDLALGKE